MTHQFWDKFELHTKAKSIGTALIETDEVKAIAERLELALVAHRSRPMGMIAAFHGPSFVGKTSACESYMEAKADELNGSFETYIPKLIEGDEQDHLASVSYVETPGPTHPLKPIIMINVGAGPTYKGLLRDTIHALTRRLPTTSATNNALTIALGKQLRKQGTKLIIVDSAHYMVNAMTGRDQTFAGGLLVSICKHAKTEVAIVGLPKVMEIYANHEELRELHEQEYEVSPFPLPIFKERYEKGEEPAFYSFVADMLSKPEFKGKSDLLGTWELEAIYKYSRGLPGRVSKLFQLGTKYAVAHKVNSLDSNILYLALRDLANTPDAKNHFRRGDNEPSYRAYTGPFTL